MSKPRGQRVPRRSYGRFQTPGSPGEFGMRGFVLAIVILVAGCAPIDPDGLRQSLNEVQTECPGPWQTLSDEVHCYDHHEIWAWAKNAPHYQRFFFMIMSSRDKWAAAYDQHSITLDQFKAYFNDDKTRIYAALQQQINADIAEQNIQDAQAAQFAQALLAGVAVYAQARADGDAAAVQYMQQHPLPQTQHTTCEPDAINPAVTHCTTSTY